MEDISAKLTLYTTDHQPELRANLIDRLNEVDRILKKAYLQRNPAEHYFLMQQIGDLPYFQEFQSRFGAEACFQIISNGQIMRIKRRTEFIEFGQQLNSLVVLLNGIATLHHLDLKSDHIETGQVIGEKELISGSSVKFTCRIIINSVFFITPRQFFLDILSSVKGGFNEQLLYEKRSFIDQFLALQLIQRQMTQLHSRFDLAQLLQSFQYQEIQPNQVIYQQGSLQSHISFVCSGEFHCLEQYEEARNNRNRTICIVGEGSILGFPDILQSEFHLHTAICKSKRGGSLWKINCKLFLLKVNYLLNRQAFQYMLNNLQIKQTQNYGTSSLQSPPKTKTDKYKNLNYKFQQYLDSYIRSSSKKLDSECLVKTIEKITFSTSPDKNPRLTRFRVENLRNKKFYLPHPKQSHNDLSYYVKAKRTKSQTNQLKNDTSYQNISRVQTVSSHSYYQKIFEEVQSRSIQRQKRVDTSTSMDDDHNLFPPNKLRPVKLIVHQNHIDLNKMNQIL